SGRGRDGLPPACRPASSGMRNARTSQHRARWQDAARQLRQLQRPRRRPGTARLRHRHVPGTRPHRYRRETPRDPARAAVAGCTRSPGRRDRHTRCDTLSKKTCEVAKEANSALLVQVKSNQPTLHQMIAEIATTAEPLSSHHSHDNVRGSDESPTVTVFDPARKLDDSDWKSLVSAIIRVERVVYTRSSRTGLLSRATETAFYVSNKPLAASRAAQAIRAH